MIDIEGQFSKEIKMKKKKSILQTKLDTYMVSTHTKKMFIVYSRLHYLYNFFQQECARYKPSNNNLYHQQSQLLSHCLLHLSWPQDQHENISFWFQYLQMSFLFHFHPKTKNVGKSLISIEKENVYLKNTFYYK